MGDRAATAALCGALADAGEAPGEARVVEIVDVVVQDERNVEDPALDIGHTLADESFRLRLLAPVGVVTADRDATRISDRLSVVPVDEPWSQRELAVAHHDAVDGSPVVGVGSDVEGDAGADAELVALGVGHRNPGDVVALADVDSASAQLLESLDLGGDVGDAQVEVDAHLALLGFGHALQDHRRVRPLGRQQQAVLLAASDDAVVERLGPEGGQRLGVGAVDDDVDVRMQLLSHAFSLSLRTERSCLGYA
jgi:hypothetical protein